MRSTSHKAQYDEHTTDVSRGTLAKSDAGDEYLQEISKDYPGADMEVYEQEPSEPRKGISRHLTEEGALPICEQCNSNGQKGPVQISVDSDGSAGFRVSMVWAHKPFGEPDCRDVYICHECFWAIQEEAYGGVDPWFEGWKAYVRYPDCRQCQDGAK